MTGGFAVFLKSEQQDSKNELQDVHGSKSPIVDGQVHVSIHPKISGRDKDNDYSYHVSDSSNDHVQFSTEPGKSWGPRMHKDSVRHFVNDLAGRVELPPSNHPDVNAVVQGQARFLGKGDDGLAFHHGNNVIKVSTTVPYHPENPGHRTPRQAMDMLRHQVALGNHLADAGIKGIQRSEFVEHGDKGFQIKPYVQIPEQLSIEQLDKVQDMLLEMHKHGYALRDQIQVGLGEDGEPVMFDIGKAAPKSSATDIHADLEYDMDNLKMLYRKHGHREGFVRRDYSEGEQAMVQVRERIDRWLGSGRVDLAQELLNSAVKKLEKEARAQKKGDDLKAALAFINTERKLYMYMIDAAREKEAFSPPKDAT